MGWNVNPGRPKRRKAFIEMEIYSFVLSETNDQRITVVDSCSTIQPNLHTI